MWSIGALSISFLLLCTSELPLNSEKVLFCDNLDAQVQGTFLALVCSINCFRWLLPTKLTSETQPVDAGLGRLLKYVLGVAFEEWLEIDEHLDTSETGKLSASEKHILVTRFVGAAWEKLLQTPTTLRERALKRLNACCLWMALRR